MNTDSLKNAGTRWALGAVLAIAVGGLAAPSALADPYGPPGEPSAVIKRVPPITTKKKFIDVTFEFDSTQDNSTFTCDVYRRNTTNGFPPNLQGCSSPATFTIKTPHLRHGKKASNNFGFYVQVTRGSQVGQVDVIGFKVTHKP